MEIDRSQKKDSNDNENNDDSDDEENENNEMIIDDIIIPPAILLNESRLRRNAVRPVRFRGTPPNPILASEFKWGKSVNDDPNNSRKQFPICLAWALTVWKSQGMTIKGLVKFLLGENEKEHGLTSVGMSRVRACEQIVIGPSCSLERLTTEISSGCRLKVRLIESKRLNVSYGKCKDFYFNN
jgi:hypothetical protein